MIINSKLVFLGFEKKVSQKTNKTYLQTLFMQNTETITCLCDDNVDLEKLQRFNEYDVILDYNVQFKSLRVLDIPASNKSVVKN